MNKIDLAGHTPLDAARLIAAGVDPSATQPREKAVMCHTCAKSTWNVAGGCAAHYEAPSITRAAAA